MDTSLFPPLTAVSWPLNTRTRSRRHLVGDGGASPDGRGARALCGKALPPGTAPDPDAGRARCVACWHLLDRHGTAFYAERARARRPVTEAAPAAAALRAGDAVAWRVPGSTKCTRWHILAAPAAADTPARRTLCGRTLPAAELIAAGHAPAACAHCRALQRHRGAPNAPARAVP